MFRRLPAAEIGNIAQAMDTVGYGVVPDCIPDEWIAQTRGFVTDRVLRNHGEYVQFTGEEAVQGTVLAALQRSDNFNHACQDIYRASLRQEPPASDFHMVLRCLSGQTGLQHAHYFHFDSYVLTALAPVIIPVEGQPGDLILFPNVRKIRRSYVRNVIDKLCLDNPLTQWALRRGVEAGWLKPVRLRMVPGNVYLFWGYRTLHTNEPCDADKIRSTALLHYVDPHARSWLRRKLRRSAPA